MRKFAYAIFVGTVVLSLLLPGCAQKKEVSSSAAIEKSKTMATTDQKVNYLIDRAKAYYNSKDFQSVVDISNYILADVDRNSQEAKNLLEEAKNQLQAAAQKAVTGVSEKLKGIGK